MDIAKKALKILGDAETTIKQMKSAIEVCKGDAEQAIYLIENDVIEL